MAKLLIVCLVCIIVASSWLTSCTAARRLQPSMPSGKVPKSTETTTSSSNPTGVGADVDSTHQSTTSSVMAESSEEVTDVDWDQLSKEELGACMGDSTEFEVERVCRRIMFNPDYGSPAHNSHPKPGGRR